MENEGKKKNVEIKTKSPMWLVILIAILVIALGCEFVYLANQRRAISEMMKQNQVKVENIIHYIRSKFSKSVDIEYSQNSVSKYIVGNASKITKLGFNCKYDIYKGIDTYFCKD